MNCYGNILFLFSIDPAELQECCQSALQSFNLCMFYEPVVYAEEENRDENLQYLDDDLVFKLVVICMSTIHLLQIRSMCTMCCITAELQINFLLRCMLLTSTIEWLVIWVWVIWEEINVYIDIQK